MKLRFLPSLFIFLSSYFPLAIIFVIKDLDDSTFYPQHPTIATVIAFVAIGSCAFVIIAAQSIKTGLPIRIMKISNKSGDMFTYSIPYMIAFYNFTLGDWKTLLSLLVFMVLMFTLAYKTQNMLVNPVLALAGYGLYDCQFKDGDRELQGLLISKRTFQLGDTCVVERLSASLFFVVEAVQKENQHAG
jgi:hypothetical protein